MQVLAAGCEPVSAMTGKEALDLHAVRLTYDCVKPKFWPRGADMHGKNTRMFIILSLRRTEDDLKVRYRSSLFRVHRFLFKVHIRPVGILHICNLWISLRKIVIYLVGRILHLRGLFLLLTLTEVTQESVS